MNDSHEELRKTVQRLTELWRIERLLTSEERNEGTMLTLRAVAMSSRLSLTRRWEHGR